jgi:amidase
MIVISKEQHIYAFSSDMKPVAAVDSGSIVEFETYDCYRGQLPNPSVNEIHKLDGINPATGPVAVNGAEPGDTLRITIRSIRLEATGTMYIRPGQGVLRGCVERPEVLKWNVEQGMATLGEGINVPMKPMIGVIGVAPAEGSISTLTPGIHGGNMDTKEIAEGAVLYLPVFQPGANLAVGDLHAAMGDGEAAVCGIEIGGRVQVQVEVLKGVSLSQPVLETEEHIIVIASAATADEACQQAAEGMFHFLRERLPALSDNELVCLMGATGDVGISQLVNPLKTAKCRFPKAYLQRAIFHG